MSNEPINVKHTVCLEVVEVGNDTFHATRFGYDGKSAYQSAVEGGYEGTEAQFNKQLADSARTYLINLAAADYQAIALQVVADMDNGHPVILYIRTENDGPLATMTHVRDAGEAYLFTTATLEAEQKNGIARLDQVQYMVSKVTGKVKEIRNKLLTSLLTTSAVQDSLDGESATLPISQRQAAALKRAITTLDGQVLKKDDVLILNGNGITETNKL